MGRSPPEEFEEGLLYKRNRRIHGNFFIAALTSNLQRAAAPGNVLLRKGEGNLAQESVANVSQVYTVDKSSLAKKIGALSPGRVAEIFAGLKLLLEPRDV